MNPSLKSAHSAIMALCCLLSLTKTSLGREGHGERALSSSGSTTTSPASERPSFIGSSFEVVLDTCGKNKTRLYVADRETNQPINKAIVVIKSSGNPDFKRDALATDQAGEYTFNHQFKEGEKIELKVDIKEETRAETISVLIFQWPKATGQCQEKAHD